MICPFHYSTTHGRKTKYNTIAKVLEISVKSGKDSASTLSLVICRVRFKKKTAKKYISIQWGGETKKTINFDDSWVSPSLSFLPERLHCYDIDFHCSYLYSYYIIPLKPCALNAEIQRFVLSFSISYWDLIKFPYFTDSTKRGVRRWKEAQRQGEDRVNLRISLLYIYDIHECESILATFVMLLNMPW